MKESNNKWAQKCLSSIVAVAFLAIMPSQAQDLEIQSNTTGYIDCSHGVKVITQEVRFLESTSWQFFYIFGETTITAQSLYALGSNGEPETLLWVRVPRRTLNYATRSTSDNWITYYCEYSILPGTKRIAKGAFDNCGNIVQLHIPSTIRYIPENCFSGLNSNALIDIIDDTQSSIKARQLSDSEKEEVGRYNLQGMKVNEDAHGVQIIQYNDGSAQKVLSK